MSQWDINAITYTVLSSNMILQERVTALSRQVSQPEKEIATLSISSNEDSR